MLRLQTQVLKSWEISDLNLPVNAHPNHLYLETDRLNAQISTCFTGLMAPTDHKIVSG